MKKIKSVFAGILSLAIFLSVTFILPQCRKEREASCEAPSKKRKQKVTEDSPEIVGKFYTAPDLADFSYFSSVDYSGIPASISSLLPSLGITLATGETAAGLALYYEGTIDTTDLSASSPEAFVLYKNSGGRVLATLYNKVSSSYVADNNIFGMSPRLGLSTVYNIIQLKGMSIDNVVVFEVDENFPTAKYKSGFEIVVAKGDGPGSRPGKCNDIPKCWGQPAVNGECIKGPDCMADNPNPDGICPESNVNRQMSKNSYTPPTHVVPNSYIIRDSVLASSLKGAKLIDDFYYIGQIVDSTDITLSFLVATYNVYNTNVLRKLANFNKVLYNDSTLFTVSEKNKIITMLDEAEDLSTNTRFQGVITSLKSDVNRLHNQTISYCRSNF
jgi:hypothetical protein